MLPLKTIVCLCVLYLTSFSALAVEVINVAQKQSVQNAREEYLSELLTRALERADYPVFIKMQPVSLQQQRDLIELDKTALDIYWSMSSPEREARAIAVKVPLFKGFIGKRVLLTSKKNVGKFKGITTLAQLGELSAVQGHDWPDTKIMAYNGLHVRPLSNYQAMFTLTSRGRIDYFPRSFIEVNSELVANAQSNLVIVPNLFISYPTGIYYFVVSSKPALAQAIELGLKKMQKSGEFDALFNEYFAKDISSLPFTKGFTTELQLDNPYF
ncbi:transporter substrate-binding domain-containing protein [uncultured Pseudoalteromonas sp.]|uniref:substrate-binding periplasmic protein n=1 Tax=uncultured Pseudoalteromonas sp. TaxID=114053 RepID=UPI0030C7FC98